MTENIVVQICPVLTDLFRKREIYMKRESGRRRSLSGPSPAPPWPDHISRDDAQYKVPRGPYDL